MTRIKFDRKDYTNHVIAQGHQEGEAAGKNIYCAAVSAMLCALVSALKRENLISQPIMDCGSGYMAIHAQRTPRVDAFFDFVKAGFQDMEKKWPDKIKLE